jgi:hypothetical protein
MGSDSTDVGVKEGDSTKEYPSEVMSLMLEEGGGGMFDFEEGDSTKEYPSEAKSLMRELGGGGMFDGRCRVSCGDGSSYCCTSASGERLNLVDPTLFSGELSNVEFDAPLTGDCEAEAVFRVLLDGEGIDEREMEDLVSSPQPLPSPLSSPRLDTSGSSTPRE